MQAKGNRTSLVAPWLRIHLPMQGTCVWSLVREDPTCLSNKALGPQLLSLPGLKPTPQNRSSHFSKKSTKDKTKSSLHSLRLEEAGKLVCGNKDPGQPKIHEKKKKKERKTRDSENWIHMVLDHWGYSFNLQKDTLRNIKRKQTMNLTAGELNVYISWAF